MLENLELYNFFLQQVRRVTCLDSGLWKVVRISELRCYIKPVEYKRFHRLSHVEKHTEINVKSVSIPSLSSVNYCHNYTSH